MPLWLVLSIYIGSPTRHSALDKPCCVSLGGSSRRLKPLNRCL